MQSWRQRGPKISGMSQQAEAPAVFLVPWLADWRPNKSPNIQFESKGRKKADVGVQKQESSVT